MSATHNKLERAMKLLDALGTTHTTLDTITQKQLAELSYEAASAGDGMMCKTAKLAMLGDRDAIAVAVAAINYAEAQSEKP